MANTDNLPAGEQMTLIADDIRKRAFARNEYNPVKENDSYDATHRNAKSDDDNKGRGMGDDGSVGTNTDKLQRIELIKGNEYNTKNQYYTTSPESGANTIDLTP